MAEIIGHQIVHHVAQAAGLYHRLVLLVGPPRSGKSTQLRLLTEAQPWPLLNVNLLLAEHLLELSPRQRPLRLPRILAEIVEAFTDDVLLLDNCEMIFSPEFRQDPLRLLQGLARNRTLVVSWPGRSESDHLIYAHPAHPEYRRYQNPDAIIVPVEPQ